MKEQIDLIKEWRRLPAGSPIVLVTVVATQGSTYRRPGARMLLTPEGWAAGSISGGCLEGDVVRTAWERTENGPALVTYDASADDDIVWGFGLGCNGIVQVLMERIPADGGVLAFLADCIENRRSGVVATAVTEGPRLGEHRYEVPEDDSVAWLVERIDPPRSLVIFGAGHDAIPLVSMAKSVGWHVSVVDGRSAYARTDRFPGADAVITAPPHRAGDIGYDERTAVVLMTHNYLHDLELLRVVLPSRAGYVGLLGPHRRAQKLLGELRREGYSPSEAELAKLHAPIGLDIGAEGADEIALAVVSEIQAFFASRPAGHLHGFSEPLHPPQTLLVASNRQSISCDM
ncbi:XdhC family protein [Fimbriimonas ginsengisoli]|uniref:Xanthine dehydrogenase n=1 Tax=Fimbriimonas ginsengisoli Gsoil 348 TaxID=661478 RepID=A0A068NMV9_FIMGI|nr:XdhC/CoxI family protein [Fimbriimonas ginsengisoli]AIE84045.1 Xanthine dehydrogenase [Fimbriimonas ginsengisoli Gsoil 348]